MSPNGQAGRSTAHPTADEPLTAPASGRLLPGTRVQHGESGCRKSKNSLTSFIRILFFECVFLVLIVLPAVLVSWRRPLPATPRYPPLVWLLGGGLQSCRAPRARPPREPPVLAGLTLPALDAPPSHPPSLFQAPC